MGYFIETFNRSQEDFDLYNKIISLTNSINDTYPGHTNWFWEKFVPGLRGGERSFVAAFNQENKSLSGVILLKNTPEEKKICTLFVAENARGQGIATKLMEASFNVLKERNPVITVSNRNINQLRRLLDKFDFKQSCVRTDVYKGGDSEIYFNLNHVQKIQLKRSDNSKAISRCI